MLESKDAGKGMLTAATSEFSQKVEQLKQEVDKMTAGVGMEVK
jgi:hypothetical protein